MFNESTIDRKIWPTFVNQSIGDKLSDLADCLLARTSIIEIIKSDNSSIKTDKELEVDNKSYRRFSKKYIATIENWLSSNDALIEKKYNLTTLKNNFNPVQNTYKFLGKWEGGDKSDIVVFEKKNNSIIRMLSALMFSLAGSHFLMKSGKIIDSTKENLITLFFVSKYLKWLRILITKEKHNKKNENKKLLCTILIKTGLLALQNYEKNIKKSKNTHSDLSDSRNNHKEGAAIDIEAIAYASEIILSAQTISNSLFDPDEISKTLKDDYESIITIYNTWFSDIQGLSNFDLNQSKIDKKETNPRNQLIYIAMRHHFPALSHLQVLKTLIDDAFIKCISFKKCVFNYDFEKLYNEAIEWLDDLLTLSKKIDAPLHFTPYMIAETLSLAVMAAYKIKKEVSNKAKITEANTDDSMTNLLTTKARQHLHMAEESFSQGASTTNPFRNFIIYSMTLMIERYTQTMQSK